MNRWTAEDDAIEAKIGELEDSIIDIQNGVGMDSYDLYRNTAGEIEARDAASRRELTPEQLERLNKKLSHKLQAKGARLLLDPEAVRKL